MSKFSVVYTDKTTGYIPTKLINPAVISNLGGLNNYNPLLAYTLGQTVVQATKIYQAIVPTTTIGVFNPVQWQEISVGGGAGGGVGTEVDPTALLRTGLTAGKILGTSATTSTSGTPVTATTTIASLDQAVSGYPLTYVDQFGQTVPTEKVFDRLSRVENQIHMQENFSFETGTAKVGTHFDDAVGGEFIYIPKVSAGKASTRRITLQLQGTTPLTASTVDVKIRKYGTATLVNLGTFTIPASTTFTNILPLYSDISTGFKELAEGDKVLVVISQDMLQVALTISMAYEHLA
jgi:hypothetical protein